MSTESSPDTPLRIVISAGEVSGDLYASKVLIELKRSAVEICARGMGGARCREAGLELTVDAYKNARVMGILELVKPLRKLIGTFLQMKQLLSDWRPDVLLLIDYPDFNLRLAKVAKHLNIPVIYFVPPKVWAWRAHRIRLMQRVVDKVAAIFPFEKEFFRERGYDQVTYVGHPLVGITPKISEDPSLCEFMQQVDLSQCVLIMAGSRPFEVQRFLPKLLAGVKKVWLKNPAISILVSIGPSISKREIHQAISQVEIPEELRILFSDRPAEEIMPLAAAGVLKCGTCNLEAALLGLPFVAIYQASWVTKVIVGSLSSLEEFSPVNVIERQSVRELMGTQIDEEKLALEVEELLYNTSYRDAIASKLARVKQKLEDAGELGSSFKQVSKMVLDSAAGAANERGR